MCRASLRILSATTLLALLAAPARSPAVCGDPDDPPSIILFIADDLGMVDLPFYSPPILWMNNDPSDDANKTPSLQKQHKLLRPDFNHLAARMMADRSSGGLGTFGRTPLPALGPLTPTPTPYSVIPQDETTSYQEGSSTPALDVLTGYGGLARLASEGIAFSRYYATSGVCEPTRSTIFSGRSVLRTGVLGHNGDLKEHEVTFAEYLRKGCLDNPNPNPCYATGLIGKWHLGDEVGPKSPWRQGFQEYIGYFGNSKHFADNPLTCGPDPADPNGTASTLYVGDQPGGTCAIPVPPDSLDCCQPEKQGENRGQGSYDVPGRGDRQSIRPCDDDTSRKCVGGPHDGQPCDTDAFCGEPNKCGCNYAVRAYRDFAINFIRRHAAEPFLLVVTFNAVHVRHEAPSRTKDHYPGNDRKTYLAMIEEVDAAIGSILDAIDDIPGLADNTVVLFTSDQGSPPVERGNPDLFGGKRTVDEGGIRVGLIGKACASSPIDVSNRIASHVDLLPTIAEAAGFPITAQKVKGCSSGGTCEGTADTDACGDAGGVCVEQQIDGRSFYGLLTGGAGGPTPTPARDFVFARFAQKITVVGREGAPIPNPAGTPVPGVKICSWADDSLGTQHIPKRGGSCLTCNSLADCQGPTPKCIRFDTGEAVHCNTCLPAAWKVKVGLTSDPPATCNSAPTPRPGDGGMWDVVSNPEQNEDFDCKQKIPDIWCALFKKVHAWNDCGLDDPLSVCDQ